MEMNPKAVNTADEIYAAVTDTDGSLAVAIYPSADAARLALEREIDTYPSEETREEAKRDLRANGYAMVDMNLGHSFEVVEVNDPLGMLAQAPAQRMISLPSETDGGELIFAVGPMLISLSDAELDRAVFDVVSQINRQDAICEGQGESVEDSVTASLEAMGLRRVRPRVTQIRWDAHQDPAEPTDSPLRDRG